LHGFEKGEREKKKERKKTKKAKLWSSSILGEQRHYK
jgi:hypothetical protein